MELKLLFLLMSLLVYLSSSDFISDSVFESHTSISGRNLLHAKKKCEVNFEDMDYSVMKRRCKGPAFPAKEICMAFKEFACPYVNQINDMNSECAKIMFSYINIYVNYPSGIFANECKEKKDGLVCPSPSLNSPNLNASITELRAPHLILLLISVANIVLTVLMLG